MLESIKQDSAHLKKHNDDSAARMKGHVSKLKTITGSSKSVKDSISDDSGSSDDSEDEGSSKPDLIKKKLGTKSVIKAKQDKEIKKIEKEIKKTQEPVEKIIKKSTLKSAKKDLKESDGESSSGEESEASDDDDPLSPKIKAKAGKVSS